MIRLRAFELLQKPGHSGYWLNKRLEVSWKSLNNMLNNQTQSIRYDTLETFCQIFECTPNGLLIYKKEDWEDWTSDKKTQTQKKFESRT